MKSGEQKPTKPPTTTKQQRHAGRHPVSLALYEAQSRKPSAIKNSIPSI
ncbi:MAG: hypothetical protein WCQ21_21570 [Verrucomicrobiota bacterium]